MNLQVTGNWGEKEGKLGRKQARLLRYGNRKATGAQKAKGPSEEALLTIGNFYDYWMSFARVVPVPYCTLITLISPDFTLAMLATLGLRAPLKPIAGLASS